MGTGCFLVVLFFIESSLSQIGIWTSKEELVSKPKTGLPWEKVKRAADLADPLLVYVSDQNSNHNVNILAAAIVYARTGEKSYQDKVIAACEKLAGEGYPALAPGIASEENRTLAWARETGAYALAADLVEFRTAGFETWLRAMAEDYIASDNRTLLQMFKKRPNNWGSHAFGSLCAIYAYLQDTTRLTEVRDYWIQSVMGPKPEELEYGGPGNDLSWHVDETNLKLINPKGAVKEGLNIDGISPDDMRRNGSFSHPPSAPTTSYHWGILQGMISGARILERSRMSIWEEADSAIYRAGYALQIRWESEFSRWKAEGDDLWLLPFFDDAYGSNWTESQPERVWEHGKNAGWPYVVLETSTGIDNSKSEIIPDQFKLYQNYPNPFNPSTSFRYSLQTSGHVQLTVSDVRGRTVSTLVDTYQDPGNYTRVWCGIDSNSFPLASGIYLTSLYTGSMMSTIKVLLLR